MKNNILLPFFLLLLLSNTNAQDRLWQAGSVFSIEQMSIDYTLTDNFDEETRNQTSTHTSIGIRIERNWNKKWSIQGGLSFSKMKFKPEMYLPWAYGTRFIFDEREETLTSPLLHQHKMNILSIPLGIKYNFSPNKRWQPFLALGINSSIKYQEKEIYKEGYEDSEGKRKILYVNDRGMDLFNIGLDLDAGIQFKVNPFLKIVLAPGIRIAEYRKENEKFKRNGDFLYQNQWLIFTQKKLSIGVLTAF